jgi:hypothetical protein
MTTTAIPVPATIAVPARLMRRLHAAAIVRIGFGLVWAIDRVAHRARTVPRRGKCDLERRRRVPREVRPSGRADQRRSADRGRPRSLTVDGRRRVASAP